MKLFNKTDKGVYLLIDMRSTIPKGEKRLKLATSSEKIISALTQHNGDKGIIFIEDLDTSEHIVNSIDQSEIIFEAIPSDIKKWLYKYKQFNITWDKIKKYLV